MTTAPSVKSPRAGSDARTPRSRRRATPGDPADLTLTPNLDAPVAPEPGDVVAEPGTAPEPGPASETPDVPADAPAGPEAAAGDQPSPADPDAAVWQAIGDPETGDQPSPDADADPAPAETGKPAKRGRPKTEPKQPGLCVHGCGQRVQRPQAMFVRGHDSLLAQELRAAYANGEKTAAQVREHAALISVRFAGKIDRSIAAVDAERTAEAEATRARKDLLAASKKAAQAAAR